MFPPAAREPGQLPTAEEENARAVQAGYQGAVEALRELGMWEDVAGEGPAPSDETSQAAYDVNSALRTLVNGHCDLAGQILDADRKDHAAGAGRGRWEQWVQALSLYLNRHAREEGRYSGQRESNTLQGIGQAILLQDEEGEPWTSGSWEDMGAEARSRQQERDARQQEADRQTLRNSTWKAPVA